MPDAHRNDLPFVIAESREMDSQCVAKPRDAQAAAQAAAGRYDPSLAEALCVPLEICQMVPEDAARDRVICQKLAKECCEAMKRRIPGKRHNWCAQSFQLERNLATE
jgi:hypothetical protein